MNKSKKKIITPILYLLFILLFLIVGKILINEFFQKSSIYNFIENIDNASLLKISKFYNMSKIKNDRKTSYYSENEEDIVEYKGEKCLYLKVNEAHFFNLSLFGFKNKILFETKIFFKPLELEENSESKVGFYIILYGNPYYLSLSCFNNKGKISKFLEFRVEEGGIAKVLSKTELNFSLHDWIDCKLLIDKNMITLYVENKSYNVDIPDVFVTNVNNSVGFCILKGESYFSQIRINDNIVDYSKLENHIRTIKLNIVKSKYMGDYKNIKNSDIIAKVKINNEYRDVIAAFPPFEVDFDLKLPDNPYLNFSYGIPKEGWNYDININYAIDILNEKGIYKNVFSKSINPFKSVADRKWQEESVDLNDYDGQKVKIVLKTASEFSSPETDISNLNFSYWGNPEIRSREEINKKYPNFLLIAIDDLRADHLGIYNYVKKTSPFIDTFARQGIIFEKAITQAPYSLPSYMSSFTSLYPSVHGMVHWSSDEFSFEPTLDDKINLFPHILRENGYSTAAFTGGGYLAGEYGFYEGFQLYYEDPVYSEDKVDKTKSTFEKAGKWLKENKGNKFFLFFHTYEVHSYRDSLSVQNYFLREGLRNKKELSEKEKIEKDISLYDSKILISDGYVKKLINMLEKLGILNNTMVIIMSDHGEELYDKTNIFSKHGDSLYYYVLRIPLIIVYKDKIKKSRKVSELVRLIDIAPTILNYANIKIPKDFQGVSIKSYIEGNKLGEDLIAFSEGVLSGPERKSVIKDKFHYIFIPNKTDKDLEGNPFNSKIRELYNIEEDPYEKDNIILKQPELTVFFQNLIDDFMNEPNIVDKSLIEKNKTRLSSETIKKLRALGYIK